MRDARQQVDSLLTKAAEMRRDSIELLAIARSKMVGKLSLDR